MLARSLVIATFAFALVACKKDTKDATPPAPAVAPVSAGTMGKDGVRRISITADDKGYTPARIEGKPGEKLTLVFTRTLESECIAQLKTPEGKLVDLPMNTPVEVAVTVPKTGEVGFACGMDMFHGVVVAQPAT